MEMMRMSYLHLKHTACVYAHTFYGESSTGPAAVLSVSIVLYWNLQDLMQE